VSYKKQTNFVPQFSPPFKKEPFLKPSPPIIEYPPSDEEKATEFNFF